MVPTVRRKSGKVREKTENQKKSRKFTFQSQGKITGSGKIKVPGCNLVNKKCRKNFEPFYADCVQVHKFFTRES